jgi:hypothetical protein
MCVRQTVHDDGGITASIVAMHRLTRYLLDVQCSNRFQFTGI